jgi:fructokinase
VSLEDKIWIIAQEPGNAKGFTIDIRRMRKCTDEGFCVAYPDTQKEPGRPQKEPGRRGLAKALAHAQGPNGSGIVGGWHNAGNGSYYFDSVKVYSTRVAAVNAAMRNRQIGIYDLRTRVEEGYQPYIPIMDETTESFNESLEATRSRSHSV